MMTRAIARENAHGYGVLCLQGGTVLQASCFMMIAFLAGWEWPTIEVAVGSHYFAVAFLLSAPIGHGAVLFARTEPGVRGDVMIDWAWRCFLPLALYAVGIKLAPRLVPSMTPFNITMIMGATLPLAIYGEILRRERLSD